MKIVDRKTFLALEGEVLYSKYQPCVFGELTIKGGNVGENDFCYQSIEDAIESMGDSDYFNQLSLALSEGQSLSMDFHCMGRDGLYDADQLFAVWEPKDVDLLIERLQEVRRSMKE